MSSLEYSDYYRIWPSYFSAGNICLDKVTHQPHRQSMQELDDANIVLKKLLDILDTEETLKYLRQKS